MSDLDAPTAIDITCPRCNAAPGADCLPAGRTHQERFTAAERRRELLGMWRSGVTAFGEASERAGEDEPKPTGRGGEA